MVLMLYTMQFLLLLVPICGEVLKGVDCYNASSDTDENIILNRKA